MSQVVDMKGQRFGLLTVLERAENDKFGKAQWLCQCDCGSEPKVIAGASLRRGLTVSCGCLKQIKLQDYNEEKVPPCRVMYRCNTPKVCQPEEMDMLYGYCRWDGKSLESEDGDFYSLADVIEKYEWCPELNELVIWIEVEWQGVEDD